MHWIAMSGMAGYMPDHCSSHNSIGGAIETLGTIFDLSKEQKRELFFEKYLRLTENDGAEYCKIEVCTCDTPSDHNDDNDLAGIQ